MNLNWTQLSPEERDARITSLLLGELVPSEAKELRAIISADPDLARTCERRERTIALLREAASRDHATGEVAVSSATAPARLSDDRRQKLLESFKTAAPARRARIQLRIPSWFVPLSAAAVLIGLLILAASMAGGINLAKKRARITRLPSGGDVQAAVNGDPYRIALYAMSPNGRIISDQLGRVPLKKNLGEVPHNLEAAGEQAGPGVATRPSLANKSPEAAIAGSEYFALAEDRNVAVAALPVVNEFMYRTAPSLESATPSAVDKERDISKLAAARGIVTTDTKAQNDGSVTTPVQPESQTANYSVAANDFLAAQPPGAFPATAPVTAPTRLAHEVALPAPSTPTRVEAAKLVQDGKLYYETGQTKEAETALRAAANLDSGNKAAGYYLDLVTARQYSEEARRRAIDEKQLLVQVESAWRDSGQVVTQTGASASSRGAMAGGEWFSQTQPQSVPPSLPSIGAKFSEAAPANGPASTLGWSLQTDNQALPQGGAAFSGPVNGSDPAEIRLQIESGKKLEEAAARSAFGFSINDSDFFAGRKSSLDRGTSTEAAIVEFDTARPGLSGQNGFGATDGRASARSFGEGTLSQQQHVQGGGGIGGFGGARESFGNRTMDRGVNDAGLGRADRRSGVATPFYVGTDQNGIAVSASAKDGDGLEWKSKSLAATRGFFDDSLGDLPPATAADKKGLKDSRALNELADTDTPAETELFKERKADSSVHFNKAQIDGLQPYAEGKNLAQLGAIVSRGTNVAADSGVDTAGLPIATEDESRGRLYGGVLLWRDGPNQAAGIQTRTEPVMEKPMSVAPPPQRAAELSDELERKPREAAFAQPDTTRLKPVSASPVIQPEVLTRQNPFSTFSLNVSDVSFKLAAASLEKGQMPEAANIRSEEFINAFDYRDPMPAPGVPLAFAWERARYPFAHNRDVVRFSVKTAAQGREASKPLNIVLLLDNSGSMERADRVRIIQESLRTLTAQLKPTDKISVVTFARTASLRVDGMSGTNAVDVANKVGGLTPEGGTNLEDALDLAYRTALRHYEASAVNRVVLLTDGAANLGNVDPKTLKAKVENYRKQGIALDCFGVGWEGFNDDLLEQLSRNGDGRYGFVNTPEEAASEFVGQLAGALRVAASDVKMQVEFNPKRVKVWRQIGYAKHQLTKEQFRDNKVDAAEIGAAESGNALYVIETNPNGQGPIATVRARFRLPQTSDYREHEWIVPFGSAVELQQSSPALRLSASASAFSEWLAASPFAGEVTTDRLLQILSGVPETYGVDPRPKRLEWMIRQAKSISGK